MEPDDDDGELEMVDRGLDFTEVSEVSSAALAVLRTLQRRLPTPPRDGLVLLNPQELVGADVAAVTLAATALVARGPGKTGALAASLALAAAQPLQPGHAAYCHEPGHTSFGLVAKVDLQPGQPICLYGGSVVTVSQVNAAQQAQLRVQPGRQGRPIVKSHLFDLPSFGQIGNARCLVADGAPIRSRQPDPSVPPHDVISRYFGALANAPSLGQAANLVALEFVGHGACGAGAQLQLRGADGKLTALTGSDADLLLPLLVLVTNAPVPAGAELLLCYGKDYFKTIAAVAASADAVRWEEERLAAGVACSDDEDPSADAAGAGHSARRSFSARAMRLAWIKAVVRQPPPRVPETLTQLDHVYADTATIEDVKQGTAIRLGGDRPAGRTLFCKDVFRLAEQRAMVMLHSGEDCSDFAPGILKHLGVHRTCPGMETDVHCEHLFSERLRRLAALGPLGKPVMVQPASFYQLWERERQDALAAGHDAPYSDSFYEDLLAPALARAAAGPAAAAAAAGEEPEESEGVSAPGFAAVQWWGHGEAAPEDEEGRSDGGGGGGDIGDDDDNMPSPAAEAAAPEQSAFLDQDSPADDVDALLREAVAQRDTHAQTAAASAAQLADAALQERLRASEAMDRARAALAKADAAQAAQTAALAADAVKAAALDAEVRRLTGIKRKRESDVAAQQLEAKRQEIADLKATLAAKEADAAALEAAREALLKDAQDAV